MSSGGRLQTRGRHLTQPHAMYPVVVSFFRVERQGEDVTLPHPDDGPPCVPRLVGQPSDDLDVGSYPGDDGSTDESNRHPLPDPVDVEGSFERVQLGPESVTTHGDIEQAEGLLVFRRVLQIAGQHDESSAGG